MKTFFILLSILLLVMCLYNYELIESRRFVTNNKINELENENFKLNILIRDLNNEIKYNDIQYQEKTNELYNDIITLDNENINLHRELNNKNIYIYNIIEGLTDPDYKVQIQTIANHLKVETDLQTYYNIEYFVRNDIDYEFYYYARGLETTWKTKEGDCTDIAILINYMLDYLNITNKIVHGYANNNLKHDWVEVYINNEWYSTEYEYYNKLVKRGDGIW